MAKIKIIEYRVGFYSALDSIEEGCYIEADRNFWCSICYLKTISISPALSRQLDVLFLINRGLYHALINYNRPAYWLAITHPLPSK